MTAWMSGSSREKGGLPSGCPEGVRSIMWFLPFWNILSSCKGKNTERWREKEEEEERQERKGKEKRKK
ncbi:unnamed protein product, partial [Gulo gulo]